MARRSVYNLPGLAPPGAIAPDLVKSGNLFFTSGIRGMNLATGELPEDPAEQFLNACHNLAELVEGAGLNTDSIGLVTNFIDSQDYRAHINTGWLELFSKPGQPTRAQDDVVSVSRRQRGGAPGVRGGGWAADVRRGQGFDPP